MNFVKRATASVTRQKGKTLILFLIIFLIGNLIACAVAIRVAGQRADDYAREAAGAKVTVDFDYDKVMEAYNQGQEIPDMRPLEHDLIEQLGERPEVKYFDYNLDYYLEGSQDIRYTAPTEEGDSESGISYASYGITRLHGVNYAPLLDIEEGLVELTDGRTFTTEEIANGTPVTLISKELAEQKNLKVGDTITLNSVIYDYMTDSPTIVDGSSTFPVLAEHTLTLEIIGILERVNTGTTGTGDADSTMEDIFMQQAYDETWGNTFYVPNKIAVSENNIYDETVTANGEELPEYGTAFVTPVYVLKGTDQIESFEAAAEPLLPEFYTTLDGSDSEAVQAAQEPLNKVRGIANIALIAGVIAALLIITLVVMLFLKDRKHEFGIYLSLGEKKGRILGQVLTEVLAVAVVAVLLSLVTGNLVAGAVSDTVMTSVSETESYSNAVYIASSYDAAGLNNNTLSADEIAKYASPVFNLKFALTYVGIALATSILACLLPMLYVLRLRPKQVLMS